MENYIGKLTQCTLDSTGIVNKYHVFFSVWFTNSTHYEMATFCCLQKNTQATLSDTNLQFIFGGFVQKQKRH